MNADHWKATIDWGQPPPRTQIGWRPPGNGPRTPSFVRFTADEPHLGPDEVWWVITFTNGRPDRCPPSNRIAPPLPPAAEIKVGDWFLIGSTGPFLRLPTPEDKSPDLIYTTNDRPRGHLPSRCTPCDPPPTRWASACDNTSGCMCDRGLARLSSDLDSGGKREPGWTLADEIAVTEKLEAELRALAARHDH